MKTIQPGHDIISLFNGSLETQFLTSEKAIHRIGRQLLNFLGSLLLIAALSIGIYMALTVFQNILDTATNTELSTVGRAANVQDELTVAYPNQIINTYIAGSGYINR